MSARPKFKRIAWKRPGTATESATSVSTPVSGSRGDAASSTDAPQELEHPSVIAERRRLKLRARGRSIEDYLLQVEASVRRPTSLRELGNECFKKGEFQNAVLYYSRAVAAEPTDHRLFSNRSASFFAMNNFALALADGLKCIALHPRWPKGYYRAGAALFKLDQLPDALDMFEAAQALDPGSPQLAGAVFDCKQRLQLLPLGFVPETGKAYLRPPTPITRDLYGSGSAFSWGGGTQGCLGHGETDTHTYPKCIEGLRGKQIVDVACGYAHVVAVTGAGETYVWGDNSQFQCGMGVGHPMVNQVITQPTLCPGLVGRRVTAVSCGIAHTAVLTELREVFVWGAGEEGQLGLGDKQPRLAPVRNTYFEPVYVEGGAGPRARAVACGYNHSIVLCEGGVCHAFGNNSCGQLGLQPLSRAVPSKRFLRPRQVHIGKVVWDDGVVAWVKHPRYEPAVITFVACGADHTVCVAQTGEVFTAGSNEFGQLGLGAHPSLAIGGEENGPKAGAHPPPRDRRRTQSRSRSPTSPHLAPPPHGGDTAPAAAEADPAGDDSEGEDKQEHAEHDARVRTPSSDAASVASVFKRDPEVAKALPGVVAFRPIRSLSSKVVMAACGAHFTVLLTELREVFTCGRGDSGQLGHGNLDNQQKPRVVAGMVGKLTESVSARSDQVVCVCRNGELYWWGSGLRYRPDDVLLEGVRKEVLEARLQFSNALPAGGPNFMVAAEDKAAPRFKQRVADYYKQRGIFAKTVITALGIKRAEDSLLATSSKLARRRRALRARAEEAHRHAEGGDGDGSGAGEAGEVGSGEEGSGGEGDDLRAPAARSDMDMAMSVMALEPMRTPSPKDTRALRVACGEDFYIAVTEGTSMHLSRLTDWQAQTEADMRQLAVLRRFQEVKAAMERQYGPSVVAAMAAGKRAEREEAEYLRDLAVQRATVEQDEEIRAMMEAQMGRPLVQERAGYTGWKSVIDAIAKSLVYNLDEPTTRRKPAPSSQSDSVKSRLPPMPPGGVKPAAVSAYQGTWEVGTPPPTIRTRAGDVLKLNLRMFDTDGQPRRRGDDRLFAFALHVTEEAAVFLTVADHMDGTYSLTGRLLKSGPYKLYVMQRQQHLQGSPFGLTVEALEPWPPRSEVYPVSDAGLRADVRVEVQEWVVQRLSGWGTPHIGHSSRALPTYHVKESAEPIQDVYRIPVPVVVPYPDLQEALRRLQETDVVMEASPTGKRRPAPQYSPTMLNPDGTYMVPKPVFMYFGKQFHRTEVARLGETVRLGVILRDKHGNVITDRAVYARVRADVHWLVGSTSYGVHTSTIRMKFSETVHTFGSVEALLEAAQTRKDGTYSDASLLQAALPRATHRYESARGAGDADAMSAATAGSGRTRALLDGGEEGEGAGLSPRASLLLSQSVTRAEPDAGPSIGDGVGADGSLEAGLFSTLSAADLLVGTQSELVDSAPAIVLANPSHDEFGLASDVVSWAGDEPTHRSVSDAESPSGDVPDALASASARTDAEPFGTASEAFTESDGGDSGPDIDSLLPWDVDLTAVPAMLEDFVISGTFGEMGDHSVSVTVSSAEVADPWTGHPLYTADDFVKQAGAAERVRGAVQDASLQSAATLSVSTRVGPLLSVSARPPPHLALHRTHSAAAMSGSGHTRRSLSLKRTNSDLKSASGAMSRRTGGDGGDTASTRSGASGEVPPELAKYVTQGTIAQQAIARRTRKQVAALHAGFHASVRAIVRESSQSSVFSALPAGADTTASADLPSEDGVPLVYNSLNRRDELYQPTPDQYIGLPMLYTVTPGPAVGWRSVVHYIDPLLLELPRVTTRLSPEDAEYHAAHIAKEYTLEGRAGRFKLPEPIAVTYRVPVAFYTALGVTLSDHWSNATTVDPDLVAYLERPDGGREEVELGSLDLTDRLERAPLAHMVPRRTLAQARNPGRDPRRVMPSAANVDTSLWYVAFASFVTGVHKLHVLQAGVECVGSPVSVDVIPNLVHEPSCFLTGEGVSLGYTVTVPEEVLEEHPGMETQCDFPARLTPDRLTVTLVACDLLGNQVRHGGAAVTATLYRHSDRPPSPASSVSSGLSSARSSPREDSSGGEGAAGGAGGGSGGEGAAGGAASGDEGATAENAPAGKDSVWEPGWHDEGRMANVKVEDEGNGTYTISYTVSVNGVVMSWNALCFLAVDLSPPPKLPPLAYESEDDDTAAAALGVSLGGRSPAGSPSRQSRRLKQKATLTETLSNKDTMAKVKADLAALAERRQQRRDAWLAEEDARQTAHKRAHWAAAGTALWEHRDWALGLQRERDALLAAHSEGLVRERAPVREPVEVQNRRIKAQRARDDRARLEKRQAERYARQQYRQRVITFLLAEEQGHTGRLLDCDRDDRLRASNLALSRFVAQPFLKQACGGQYAVFGEASGDTRVNRADQEPIPHYAAADSELEAKVGSLQATLTLERRRHVEAVPMSAVLQRPSGLGKPIVARLSP